MMVEVITDAETLARLEGPWDRLVEEDRGDGVFLRSAWLCAWWRAYGAELAGRLHVVCLRDGHGELVGAAPFYVATQRTARDEVRFVGSGGDTSPDYLNVLARPGQETAVAAAVADHLWRRGARVADALLLCDMADDALMTHRLEAALRARAGLFVGRAPDAVCPYLTLAHSPERLWQLVPHSLRRVQRARRKLERDHRARFFLWGLDGASGRLVADGMEHLARLHHLRFAAKGVPHGFSSQAYVAFHQDAAAHFHRLGLLRLYCLEADRQLVAMLYCFRHRDCIYYYQGGFDPGWKQASVGQVLLSYALEHAITEGARRYDFLKGNHRYKSEWATGQRATIRLCAAPLDAGGLRHLYRAWARPWAAAAAARLRAPGARLLDLAPAAFGLPAEAPPRHVAKLALAAALYHSGALGAALRVLRIVDTEPRIVTLAYHGVRPRAHVHGDSEDAISSENLASQLAVLRRLFAQPPLEPALAALTAATPPAGRYPVLVTFDDGHEEVLRQAGPVLQRYGFPAAFFVTAGAVGSEGWLWPDEVTALILGAHRAALRLTLGGREERFSLGAPPARVRVAGYLKRRLKELDYAGFVAALRQLRAQLGGPPPHHREGTRMADWQELRAASCQGLVIGAHSMTHPVLTRLPDAELRAEVAGSRRLLEGQLAAPVLLFAYPNGLADDFEPRVVAEVAAAGFTHAFTMLPGTATPHEHPLLLPRIAPEDRPGVMLGLDLVRIIAADVRASWRREARRLPARALATLAAPAALPARVRGWCASAAGAAPQPGPPGAGGSPHAQPALSPGAVAGQPRARL